MKRMDDTHPRWEEFLDRLEGPEGCNFTGELDEDGKNKPETVKWSCAGGKDKSKATAILEAMGDIDIPASLAYFEASSGYCDCEILFNVAK